MTLAIISLLIFDLIPAQQQRAHRPESTRTRAPFPTLALPLSSDRTLQRIPHVDMETFAFYGLYSLRNVWSVCQMGARQPWLVSRGDSVAQGTFSVLWAL